MLHFNSSLDAYHVRSENMRRVRGDKSFDREAELRRKLKDVNRPGDQRRKFGWRRPFYPAGA